MLEKGYKITREQTQRMIFTGLAVLLFLLPLPQCFLPDSDRAIGMQATVLMLSLIYFGIIFAIEGLNKRIFLRQRGMAFFGIGGLVLTGLVSVLLSPEKEISLYGTGLRSEGFFSLAAYFMLFLVTALLVNQNYRRMLLHLFLLLGSIVAILGVLQFTLPLEWGERFSGMAYIPMRNPNFYGAFAVLFTGAAIGGFLTYRKESEVTHPFRRFNRAVWYLLVLLGYAACISAASSVVYVGLCMIFLAELFLELVTKRRSFLPSGLLLTGLVAIMFLLNFISKGSVWREFFSVGNQIREEGSLFADGVGSSRMRAWKCILGLLPRYWLSGCGIERLGTVYYNECELIDGIYFDKAHNEYLNLWITEGIFAVIFYLVFLFALFLPGVLQFWEKLRQKLKGKGESYAFDDVTRIAFFAFFGYIAQAFFNISVIQAAPYFWIICGLLYSRKKGLL